MRRRSFLASMIPMVSPALGEVSGHEKAVREAIAAILQETDRAERDTERPIYHFHPPARFLADPCGILLENGWYHLFYQTNPYASVWERAHWGHARSRNLVDWEHMPIALAPEPQLAQYHTFTGTAWRRTDGAVLLFYQSIGNGRSVRVAHPVDPLWFRFEKSERELVSETTHAPYAFYDWGDPNLFVESGRTFMVCGGNARRSGGKAVLHLYEATTPDLMEWRHVGPVFSHPDRAAITLECAGLLRMGRKWVLTDCAYRPCEYYVGDFDLDRGTFQLERYGVLDAGLAYAGRLIPMPDGTVMAWQYITTNLPPTSSWNNVMGIPRTVVLDEDGTLRQFPLQQFESLRGKKSTLDAFEIANETRRLPPAFAGAALELKTTLRALTAKVMGVRLRCGAVGKYGVEVLYRPGAGSLSVNQRFAFYTRSQSIPLRIFLDRRVVEVYTDDGLVALATNLAADPEDLGIEVFAEEGKAAVESLECWPMSPAQFSLEYFSF